jgi:hypothetical protein
MHEVTIENSNEDIVYIMRSDLKKKKKNLLLSKESIKQMIMKNIFKVTLLVITIIFSSSSVLAQSNDKKANAIVEEMVTAMGGMKNYDAVHFIQWDFVNRKLWNKWTGDVRIENPSANQVILVNINT